MLKKEVRDNLNLYHSNSVCLTDAEGRTWDGTLTEIREEALVLDTEQGHREFLYEGLEDMECLGYITDYHTYKGTGEINDIYEFKVNNHELFEKIKYLEYTCKVGFHLELNKKITAKDVKLIEAVHVINEGVLTVEKFLYTLSDGRRIAGTLGKEAEAYRLFSGKGEAQNLNPLDITDITRCPKVNEHVIVNTATHVLRGLVSAVTEVGFNLLEEGKLHVILFAEIEKLRFFGRMSLKSIGNSGKKYGMIDKKYGCKLPHYLSNEDDEKFVYDPDIEWIYNVGVNERGLIAKDAEINRGKQMTEAADWEIGIIAYYSKDKQMGYIGDRYYADDKVRKGTVPFRKVNLSKQLAELLEEGKDKASHPIYVVKYMFNEEGDYNPSRVELLSVYDGRYVARVEVNEGSVRAVPYFYAARKSYLGRNVEVELKNGQVRKGIWECYGQKTEEQQEELSVVADEKYDDANGIVLNDNGRKLFVAYGEIQEIRTMGTIREFSGTDGFGKVDDGFSMYIVDVEAKDRVNIAENVRVSFVIRDMPEDKRRGARRYEPWTECKDIKVLEDSTLDVYVISHEEGVYRVCDKATYGTPDGKPYEIAATLFNPFKELDKYDYPARFSIREEKEGTEYVAIHSVGEAPVPKKMRGYLTALEEERATLVAEEDYGKRDEKQEYPVAYADKELIAKLHVSKFDYLVEYEWQDRGIFISDMVMAANGKPVCKDKLYFGYLSSYDKKFATWYITPANGARKDNKDTYQQIKCYNSNMRWEKGISVAIRKSNDKYMIDAEVVANKLSENYYQVAYTLERAEDKKNCAHGATIVDVVRKPRYKKVEQKTEVVNLREKAFTLGLPFQEQVEYRYGMIKVYDPDADTFYIVSTAKGLGESLCVANEEVEIRFAKGMESMDTKNNWYLVRYYEYQETEASKRYCVEVLLRYKKTVIKKYYDNMRIEGECLLIESSHGVLCSNEDMEPPKNATSTMPDFVPGESILYKEKEEKRYKVSTFKEQGAEGIVLANNQILDLQQDEVYRFGVLTGMGQDQSGERNDAERREITMGYLNYALGFRLRDAMERKVYNQFVQDTKRRLYIYRCKDGNVTTVQDLTREILNDLDWKQADIQPNVEKRDTERIIKVKIREDQRELSYYWGDNNNPDVNAYMKKKADSSEVYVQEIACPDWEEGVACGKLRYLVADIQVDKEFIKQMKQPNYIKVLQKQGSMAEYVYWLLYLQKNTIWKKEHVAYLFYPDFYPEYDILDKIAEDENLSSLFGKGCKEKDKDGVRQLVSHIMALDTRSFEFLRDSGVLSRETSLLEQVRQYCQQVIGEDRDDIRQLDILLEQCRSMYQELLKDMQAAFKNLSWEDNKICEGIVGVFNQFDQSQDKRMQLLDQEDLKRMETVRDNCKAAQDKNMDFQRAYKQIRLWFDMVTNHPTPFMTEILSGNGREEVKERAQIIFNDIHQRIEKYHNDSKMPPNIRCKLNEKDITTGQHKTYILVKNVGENGKNCIDADVVKIQWEIPQFGLREEESLEPLKNGMSTHFVIDLKGRNAMQQPEKITFRWKRYVEYSTYSNRREVLGYGDAWEEEYFELVEQEDREDKTSPYKNAARGGTLRESDVMNIERSQRKEFFAVLTDEESVSAEQLRPGAIVKIHGQKECGKTSFYTKNIEEIKRRYGKKAIVIYKEIDFSYTLDTFEFELKNIIITKLYDALKERGYGNQEQPTAENPQAEQSLEKERLVLPLGEGEMLLIPRAIRGMENWKDIFTDIFTKLKDKTEYQVILAIDEFTGFCADILKSNQKNYLKFIREFSNLGMIQIYIGHAAMTALVGKLGEDNVFKTAKNVDLTTLTPDEAKKVIGMASNACLKDKNGYLDYDPYGTELGKRAVELLKDLSGNCPSMLMKLCHYMYEYYLEKQGNYLYEEDVINMLNNDIFEEYLTRDKFEMILYEAGDSDQTRASIEAYLEYVAVQKKDSAERLWKYDDQLAKEETGIENPGEIRELLAERKVLEYVNGDSIRIVMGVYEKFVRYKKGYGI